MQIDSKIVYGNNIIADVSHTKFLDLVIGNTLSWINQVDRIVNKLSSVCLCLDMLNSYVPLIFNNNLVHSFPHHYVI